MLENNGLIILIHIFQSLIKILSAAFQISRMTYGKINNSFGRSLQAEIWLCWNVVVGCVLTHMQRYGVSKRWRKTIEWLWIYSMFSVTWTCTLCKVAVHCSFSNRLFNQEVSRDIKTWRNWQDEIVKLKIKHWSNRWKAVTISIKNINIAHKTFLKYDTLRLLRAQGAL